MWMISSSKDLDSSRVANEGGGHLEPPGWNVADCSLHIVGNPFHEVARVLVLDVQHLLVHFLHGHPAAEDGGNSEVTTMPGVAGSHHVLGVEHLLRQLWHGEGTVLLASTCRQRGESGHEEVKTREGDHVDCKLSQISVQLTGEPQAGCDTRHGEGDQVVKIAIGGGGQLQCSKADVIECLVVDTESLVGVLHELMDRKGGIVRLNNGVGNLRRRHDRVRVHDSVWELLPNLGDQKCSHARASATAKRVSELETLKTIATFRLLPHDVEHAVHQLGALGVVTLRPVVASAALTKDEVVWPKQQNTSAYNFTLVETSNGPSKS